MAPVNQSPVESLASCASQQFRTTHRSCPVRRHGSVCVSCPQSRRQPTAVFSWTTTPPKPIRAPRRATVSPPFAMRMWRRLLARLVPVPAVVANNSSHNSKACPLLLSTPSFTREILRQLSLVSKIKRSHRERPGSCFRVKDTALEQVLIFSLPLFPLVLCFGF